MQDLFPDGDDGQNIPDDEKPVNWPWEILEPGTRRNRRRMQSANSTDTDIALVEDVAAEVEEATTNN